MTEPTNTVFLDFLKRYGPAGGEEAPVRLVREVFGVEPDAWQQSVLRDWGRGERRISIRSCHGTGKTTVAAWLVWCMLLTRFPQKTAATAPSKGQLEDALVAEVMAWGNKLPPVLRDLYEFKQNRIELKQAPDESFFSARTARAENPEALQGVHAAHVLLIGDEASGIPEPIYEAASGSMSGDNATTLLLSNPVRTTGFFYQTQTSLKDMWRTYHIGFKDSPRVSDDFAHDIARRYGLDSNAYRVRVLGEFPKGDLDTIIPFELIESARSRDVVVRPDLREIWGVDVARFGDDETALVRRSRLAVNPFIESWQGKDLMETAGMIKARYDACDPSRKPDEILVDVIGMGGGVVDRLRELGLPVRGVNVAEAASAYEKYRGLRTELWFKGKEWLEGRDRALPRNCTCPKCGDVRNGHAEQLAEELAAQRFRYLGNGLMMAAPKDDMKKIIKRSPNVADAFLLTFASEPASLIHGSATSLNFGTNWNEPIRRGLAVV